MSLPLEFSKSDKPPIDYKKEATRDARSQGNAGGLIVMAMWAIANAAAGGTLVWYLMKDEPVKLATETEYALGKLQSAVINMGCAAKDELGTWYLKRPDQTVLPAQITNGKKL